MSHPTLSSSNHRPLVTTPTPVVEPDGDHAVPSPQQQQWYDKLVATSGATLSMTRGPARYDGNDIGCILEVTTPNGVVSVTALQRTPGIRHLHQCTLDGKHITLAAATETIENQIWSLTR